MERNGWRSLAILSAGPDEGKTTTAINLAVSIAADHRHTALLVDFDFKRPTMASRFGLVPERGSDDALRGTVGVEECLYHPDAFDRLVVFPARDAMSHSSEILTGPRCREVVKERPRAIRTGSSCTICHRSCMPMMRWHSRHWSSAAWWWLPKAGHGATILVRTIELLNKTSIVGTVLYRAAEAVSGY